MPARRIGLIVLLGCLCLNTTYAIGQDDITEPGEGGMTTEEACEFYLKSYREGDPGISGPCDEENYKMITIELGCSDTDKAEADAIRARCGGAPKKPKEADKGPCGFGTVEAKRVYGVDYECVQVTNNCAFDAYVRYTEYNASGQKVNSTGTECVPKETTKLTDVCVAKGERTLKVENPAVSCGASGK